MNEVWKKRYAQFMIIWAVVSQIWLLLQAIKIFKDKDASGVSLASYIVLIFSNIFWFVYGMFVIGHDKVIIISSIIAFLLSIVIVVGIALYN